MRRKKSSQSKQAQNSAEEFLDFYRRNIPPKWQADPPHIRRIAEELGLIRDGKSDRLAVHMPPRHAKTESLTVRGAAWLMLQDPTQNVLVTAASDRLAKRFSRKVRQIVAKELGTKLDKAADDEWIVPQGGTFVARGVGSPPVGIGFKYIFIDDPIRSRETANSETFREKAKEWYSDDIYTRLEPDGAIILNGTRWHHDDVFASAVAIEPEAFRFLVFRAFAEEDDTLGREPGAPLWPARYDTPALERFRKALVREEGEYSWQALYQQHPTPKEGALFKVGKLEIVDALPAGLKGVRRWDMAASQGSGDWTAGVKMFGPCSDDLFYVADVIRGRWEPNERNQQIKGAALADGTGIKIWGPQDPGAAGIDAANAFKKMLAGYTVATERETGSKEVRADPFAAQVNAGNVRLLKAPWNTAFIEELRVFTGAANGVDDQVDAAAGAFNKLSKPRVQWRAV